MKCPKCKHVQNTTVECESCGIIFTKYYKLIVKKKFNEGVGKYNNKEYQAALEIFKSIVNAKIPKEEQVIKECCNFISMIDNNSSANIEDFESLILTDTHPQQVDSISGQKIISEIPVDEKHIVEPQPISEGQRIDKEPIIEQYKPQNNIYKIYIKNKRILFGIVSGVALITIIGSSVFIFLTRYQDKIISGSFDEVFKKAEKGSVEAQYTLGLMYKRGEGVRTDLRKAVEWFTKAGDKGNAGALFEVGSMHITGENGIKKDLNMAKEKLMLAAEKGNADAQLLLAAMYKSGVGVTQDEKESLKLYSNAIGTLNKFAEQKDADAQRKLALIYSEGRGVIQDKNKAKELRLKAIENYTIAAEKGSVYAQNQLGHIFSNGKIAEKDYGSAIKWYTKAAEQGHVISQFILGSIYFSGEYNAKDLTKAKEWFLKASDQGDAEAQFLLASLLYDSGRGKIGDKQEAINLLTKASENGQSDAQYLLGNMYYEGKNVKEDWVKAKELCTKAAENGNEKGKECLRILNEKHKERVDSILNFMGEFNKTSEQKQAEKKAKCQQDCAVNKYQYSNSCYLACMGS